MTAGTRSPGEPATTVGVVLAAGDGTRLGIPKGLVRAHSGRTWAYETASTLMSAGCDTVLVVVGARADDVQADLPSGAKAVPSPNWENGMSESLRSGLRSASRIPGVARIAIMPVDTPGVPADAVRRVLLRAGPGRDALARAVYHGAPGHPVVLGVDHVRAILDELGGDNGANYYLMTHGALVVECADLGNGDDVDTPDALAGFDVPPPYPQKIEEEKRS